MRRASTSAKQPRSKSLRSSRAGQGFATNESSKPRSRKAGARRNNRQGHSTGAEEGPDESPSERVPTKGGTHALAADQKVPRDTRGGDGGGRRRRHSPTGRRLYAGRQRLLERPLPGRAQAR